MIEMFKHFAEMPGQVVDVNNFPKDWYFQNHKLLFVR